MKIKHLAKIVGGQDGAIFGKYLFRFGHNGIGKVYDVESILTANGAEIGELATFKLDKAELICPHSNSVSFGSEFYNEGDEFPLLYSNIYNNYANTDTPLKGVCCVYRIFRTAEGFDSELVQIIEIGFVEDPSLWKMSEDADGKRPYGNFVVDRERNIYYGFVMRESTAGTRYFAFDLPHASDGIFDKHYGVKKVVLTKDDIVEYFDCEHHIYVQGACVHASDIYSLEGFNYTPGTKYPPVLRIIDPNEKKQVFLSVFLHSTKN